MAHSTPTPGAAERPDDAPGDPTAAADPGRIVDAALAVIERAGWRSLSLAAVAEEAGLPLLAVYRVFPSRTAILCGIFRRTDEAALAAPADAAADERPRDRVFDLLMRRFDALQPHRAALARLRRELPADPPALFASGAALLRSMRLTLDAAGFASYGIGGAIAVRLTAAAYLAAAHTWVGDESTDLAPTMAALDRRLRGIEGWFGRISRSSGPRRATEG